MTKFHPQTNIFERAVKWEKNIVKPDSVITGDRNLTDQGQNYVKPKTRAASIKQRRAPQNVREENTKKKKPAKKKDLSKLSKADFLASSTGKFTHVDGFQKQQGVVTTKLRNEREWVQHQEAGKKFMHDMYNGNKEKMNAVSNNIYGRPVDQLNSNEIVELCVKVERKASKKIKRDNRNANVNQKQRPSYKPGA